jgi:uncharacterized membrane protein YwzB
MKEKIRLATENTDFRSILIMYKVYSLSIVFNWNIRIQAINIDNFLKKEF